MQNFVNHGVTLVVFCAIVCLLSSFANAQRRRGWDPSEYLKTVDRNNNGQMDPDEIEGRLKSYILDLGFSDKQPVPIADIVNAANGSTRKREEERERKSTSSVVRKVPGFGVETQNGSVQGFSGDTASNDAASLEKEYGETIMTRVQETINSYDRDGSGNLEGPEIERIRWGRPRPSDSDLNNDGILTPQELAERFKAREQVQGRGGRGRGGRGGSDQDSSGSNSENRDRARRAAEEQIKNAREQEGYSEREGEGRGRGRYREPSGEVSDSDARAKAKERAREEYERKKRESQESKGSSSSKGSSGSGSSSNSGSANRYEKHVDSLLKQMDKNEDGALDSEELKKLRRAPKNLDANSDGIATRAEMIAAYTPKSASSQDEDEEEEEATENRSRSNSSRKTSSSRSNRSNSSGVFGGKDGNGDGLLQMHEFTDKWTMEKIEEFQGMDSNNDGMLNSSEYRNRKR